LRLSAVIGLVLSSVHAATTLPVLRAAGRAGRGLGPIGGGAVEGLDPAGVFDCFLIPVSVLALLVRHARRPPSLFPGLSFVPPRRLPPPGMLPLRAV